MSVPKNRVSRLIDGVERIRDFNKPTEIALFLRELEYKGTQSDGDCPIARFMLDCIGDPDARVQVTPFSVRYRWGRDWVELAISDTPAEAFVTNFDRNLYPDLIDTEPLATE